MRACIATVKSAARRQDRRLRRHARAARLRVGRRIPVLMAASGPKAIEVAGEVADGVLLLVGFNRGIVERALEPSRARRQARRDGGSRTSRSSGRCGPATAATTDGGAAPGAAHRGALGHPALGRLLARSPPASRCRPLEIPDAVHQVYPDLSHAHDWEAAIAATSFVPDEVVAQLCDAIGLIGTPEDCAARIVEMAKLGVRNLYLMPLQTFAAAGGGDRRVPRRGVPAAEVRRFTVNRGSWRRAFWMHVTDRLIVAHVDRPIPGSTGRVSLLRSAMRGPAGQTAAIGFTKPGSGIPRRNVLSPSAPSHCRYELVHCVFGRERARIRPEWTCLRSK